MKTGSPRLVALLLLIPAIADAQLYGNAIPAELLNLQAGNVWFGSVRDHSGAFVPDATVILDTGLIEYVAVTGVTGRFRLVLPESTVLDEVMPGCAKPGYSGSVMRLRRPAGDALSPVELTCLVD